MSDMAGRSAQNERFMMTAFDASDAPHLDDRTPLGCSEALDALVKEVVAEARSFATAEQSLEIAMRRAFKLAVDTELEALAEVYDKLMAGMERSLHESHRELAQKMASSRTWIKIHPKETG